jgi:Uma2 family endonuclease
MVPPRKTGYLSAGFLACPEENRMHPTQARTLSLEEFEQLEEEDAWRLELVRGRLVREPRPAPLHARVLARLCHLLEQHLERTDEARVFVDPGVILSRDPPTVRGPDLAVVRRERLPDRGYPPGLWDLVPDMAVEVVSPSNTAMELQEKVLDYLEAGVRRVWVVDPSARTVTTYAGKGRVRLFSGNDVIEEPKVLPKLRLPLEQIFRP